MTTPTTATTTRPRRTGSWVPPVVLLVVGVVACAMAASGADDGSAGAVRAVATLAFFLFGPGWAVAGFLRTVTTATRWFLAAAFSCAIAILGAQVMASTGSWHPVGGLYVLVGLATVPLVRLAWAAR
ncbi:hypothetical protein [Actinomycetospora sp. TBRC 11914]|uniref:hypothetical protein n=1 Tax=Actinomycetospora sp. TBRC 11914 TaxID=2729387 RepID=UPI00145C614E|nr:hypothetical protein [Actinomycetospora sp. TBRC 11914]NMO90351.1 hypothetical protein [Actinomycetospora sp. TBRC 11914]